MKRTAFVDSASSTAGDDLLTDVRAEQVRRWRAGERPPAEEFLTRHPELADDAEAAQVVIYGEALLREELDGTPPDPAEYAARFPDHAVPLSLQFELHGPLSQSAANPELPGFEIVRELGRGGMGVVYLAREVSLGRLVAVKMLLSGEFASAALRRRFRTEAESAARLRHPNIVTVHATGEQSGRPYLVMEYVEGDSLDRVLAGTPLDPPAAARLLLPLAEAVEHAHRAGVVHRDLKPANILMQVGSGQPAVGSEDSASSLPAAHCSLPTAMIADFGLARTSGGSGATVTGQILGTPSYMAPEQAACAREIGPAADIYSLGAILYECITGRPPFKAATPLETITQVTSREPAAPHSLNPAVPRDLETICLKCLAKEPVKRYGTAVALADDLRRFLEGRPVVARPVGALGRAWRGARRRPALAGMALALLIFAGAAMAGMTALYLRADGLRRLAERRESESMTYRRESADRMSRLAHTLIGTPRLAEALELHRACADEFARLAEAGDDPSACRLARADHMNMTALMLLWVGRTPDALEAADAAVAAYEACVAEQPDSAKVRQGWLLSRHNRAAIFRQSGRVDEAAAVLNEVIAETPAAHGYDESPGTQLRDFMGALYADRAEARRALGRFAEAAADLDEAMRRDGGAKWAELTVSRAYLRARCGRAAEAVDDLRGPLANPHLSVGTVYTAACTFAVASAADGLPPAARESAAVDAFAALRRAFAADPSLRAVAVHDSDLNPLRGRAEFESLLAGR